jgi:superfamily II DNA/RNA helicase
VTRTTANYLRASLAERAQRVWLLTGEMAPGDFEGSLHGFTSSGGVLVCTAVALQGIDLRETDAFIHYDPPESAQEWGVRLSRSPDAAHYLLKDESGVLAEEWNFASEEHQTSPPQI